MSNSTPPHTDEIAPIVPELPAPARADGGTRQTRPQPRRPADRRATGSIDPLVPDLR